MDSDIKLIGGKMEIVGDNVVLDAGIGANKKIELNASYLKIGKNDIGQFQGYEQHNDGGIAIGSRSNTEYCGFIKDNMNQISIGSTSNKGFKGYFQYSDGKILIGSSEQGSAEKGFIKEDNDDIKISGNKLIANCNRIEVNMPAENDRVYIDFDGKCLVTDCGSPLKVDKSLKGISLDTDGNLYSKGNFFVVRTNKTTVPKTGKVVELDVYINLLEEINNLTSIIQQLEIRIKDLEEK